MLLLIISKLKRKERIDVFQCKYIIQVNNALSVFNVENEMSMYIAAVFLMVVPLIYAFYINKTVKE